MTAEPSQIPPNGSGRPPRSGDPVPRRRLPRRRADGLRRPVVLALDAGTGSGRATLVSAEGRIVAQASRAWRLPVALDGSQDLPVEAMAAQLDDAVREVLAAAEGAQVAALATTSLRGALIVLDRDRTVLWACGSSDARAVDEARKVAADEERLHAVSGQLASLAALPRLRWLARHRPDVVERAVRLQTLDAWMAGWLADDDVPAAVSSACTTGLLDLGSRAWAPLSEDASAVGATEPFAAWLPGLAEAGTVVGLVSRAAARRTGLPAGIPIAAAGGDAQVAGLGLGCTEPGDTAAIMGSHWQQTVTLARPAIDAEARFRVIAHALPGRWQADAICLAAGTFLAWYVAAFGAREGSERAVAAAYRALEAEAAALPPGSGGVFACAGLPMTDPRWRHAAPSLLGFALGRPEVARASAFRAILEAGCLSARANLLAIGERVAPVGIGRADRAIGAGGGGSRSDLACRILADTTGRPVERAASAQSSVLGAAVCAGVACGWHRDVASGARAVARVERTFEPDAAAHAAYLELAHRWEAAAVAQRALAEEGVTTPVWRPVS